MRIFSGLIISIFILSVTARAELPKILTLTGSAEGLESDDKPSFGGFSANSHLLVGTECVLFDTQFTIADARRVAGLIKNNCAKLRAIVVTHEHPDHYWGASELLRIFPKTPVVSTTPVVEEAKKQFAGKYGYWKQKYGEQILDEKQVVFPEPRTVAEIQKIVAIDGLKVDVFEQIEGESAHSIVVSIKNLSALIVGDLVFNRVHLWLADNHPLESWKARLAFLKSLNAARVYAGHSRAGEVPRGELIDDNLTYLSTFQGLTSQSLTNAEVKSKMKEIYGSYILPGILEASVDVRYPAK
jgi:glyoxylase-like metal-dependent hydrolase (beta-lactamase superfamily II)